MRRGRLTDQGIAGEFVDEGMKRHVCLDLLMQRTTIDCSPSGIETSRPFEPGPLSTPLRRKAAGEPVQHLAYLIEILNKIDIERRDNQAAPCCLSDEPAIAQ